ncbi:MAG: dephospho-CoA kinase [Phycisphaerales bacterium]|jgi:dephospho-CoA kinase
MRERVIMIGLAGGIGSGKSRVAKEFAALGCAVSDSDADSRMAFARPEVIEALRAWWGDGVFDSGGQLDRSAVARIVFSNDSERVRLEKLIHPLVHEARERVAQEALAAGALAVVVDAPLLFEAGIDGVCDAVVFVDCPVTERVRRVVEGRGWAPGELERREKAQMPLDVKRSRSDYVVTNDGRAPLGPRVREVLDSILASDPQSL